MSIAPVLENGPHHIPGKFGALLKLGVESMIVCDSDSGVFEVARLCHVCLRLNVVK